MSEIIDFDNLAEKQGNIDTGYEEPMKSTILDEDNTLSIVPGHPIASYFIASY